MPQFILKIELGNEAMKTRSDVYRALSEVCLNQDNGIVSKTRANIRDINGNKVGYYEVIQ